jgi:GPI-anchor transamidase subunit U
VIYIIPVCLRLCQDPLYGILILVGIISTWKSYPALGDSMLWTGLLSCFPDDLQGTSPHNQLITELRHPLFSFAVNLYTSILLPLLHSLWLLTGTGNANFFYAATMVYGLNASLAIIDVLGARLRLDVKRKLQSDEALAALKDERWTVVQLSSPR